MSRAGFQKSVRLFHKFSEETTRRRGGTQAGRDSVAHLAALDAVLKAQRPFTPDLLEPLAAFTSLLQSSQLPPEFGNYSFGDALSAIEEAQAERRQNDEQLWEFEGEVSDADAALVTGFAAATTEPAAAEHQAKLQRFVLDAAQMVDPGSLLVVGALAEPALPLAELCARFARVTLSDLDLTRLQELVRRAVPEAQRERVRLERYDVTGAALAFTRAVEERVAGAASAAHAEQALLELLQSYDVTGGSAGLSAREERPDLAVSAMLLSRLGEGFQARVRQALQTQGGSPGPALGQELALFETWLVHHHVQALLRRAKATVLVSAVSEVRLQTLPNGKKSAVGEPRDLLSVEQLVERLPESVATRAEASWEVTAEPLRGPEKLGLLTLVEAVLV